MKWPNESSMRPCQNCYAPSAGLFCGLDCAVERYALLHESMGALERQKATLIQLLDEARAQAKAAQATAPDGRDVGAKGSTQAAQGDLLIAMSSSSTPNGIDPPSK